MNFNCFHSVEDWQGSCHGSPPDEDNIDSMGFVSFCFFNLRSSHGRINQEK